LTISVGPEARMTTDVPAPGRTALRCLVVTLLLTVALLDTARTGIGLRGLSHPTTRSAVLAVAGVAAAFVVLAVVDGCVAGRRWPTGPR
jgi:hypothetical protein